MKAFSMRFLIGAGFLGYALAFLARPDTGVYGYIQRELGIPGEVALLLFTAFGIAIALFRVSPAWRVVLCFPLALLAAASFKRALEDSTIPLTGAWSLTFCLLLIIAQAFREARRGDE